MIYIRCLFKIVYRFEFFYFIDRRKTWIALTARIYNICIVIIYIHSRQYSNVLTLYLFYDIISFVYSMFHLMNVMRLIIVVNLSCFKFTKRMQRYRTVANQRVIRAYLKIALPGSWRAAVTTYRQYEHTSQSNPTTIWRTIILSLSSGKYKG